MDNRLVQSIQIISIALLAWVGYKLLDHIHSVLVFVVIFFAACSVVTVWMLRYERQSLAPLYAKPYIKQYVNWVCRWTGDQPPVDRRSNGPAGEFLLNTDEDFSIAARRAKHVVMGHDQVVDCVLSRIRDAVMLRKRQRDSATQPPLASFLLVGGDGVGKRYLARVLAKLLYRSNSVLVFECDKETPESLLGTKGTTGELLESVRRQPFQMIILEKIDAASPELIRALQPVLTRGACRSPSSGREISFQHTTVVMTTTKAASLLGSLAAKPLSERAWHEKAVESMTAETRIDHTFLNAVTDVILCQQPSDDVMSKVTAMLMRKESADHGVILTTVDPLIIVSEVMRINDDTGFSLLPQEIKKLLRKPLLAAAEGNHKSMSLHVRMPPTQAMGKP